MKLHLSALLGLFLLACGQPSGDKGHGEGEWEKEEYIAPVRVELPGRGEVEDYVETQATLESDRRADVHAKVGGEILERLKDVGDLVRGQSDGDDSLLLARIDDRDLLLALKEAEIKLKQKRGSLRQLEIERERSETELEQANVSLREAEAILKRTTTGIKDDTISVEEHETAQFGRNLAEAKVLSAKSSLARAVVALELGSVAIEEAEVARDRAAVAADGARIRAPFDGVVTYCDVRHGEQVTKGKFLYRIEDPASLVVYGDIPVRQAHRVRVGNGVRIGSTATKGATKGKVVMVAPTVERETGTVRVKVRVEPAEGFKPGLFVTLGIVVERRTDALVVPKRAVLHHDEDGAFLFTIADDKAERRIVETGFQSEEFIEIADGIEEDSRVVVEGQDTLSDGAKVEIQEDAPRPDERGESETE